MSELFGGKEDKKQMVKELIKKLHAGVKPDEVKDEFKDILKGIEPKDIAEIEEELINEGIPIEEIHRLCDVHLAVFKESLEKDKELAPSGHPIHTLMEEHEILLQVAGELKEVPKKIKEHKDFDSAGEEIKHLNHIVKHLKESENHHIREENVLFPHIEKHGVTQPPSVMWMEHNKMREIKKNLYAIVENHEKIGIKNFSKQLDEAAIALSDMLSSHIYKENNILYPTAMKLITENEWNEIKEGFDDLEYCCFTPESAKKEVEKTISKHGTVSEGKIVLETGSFSKQELETLLNTLPVDITFVDKEDTVRYFSQSKERIFPRAKAVIGRKVQLCHPKQSLHKVEQILNDFKNNKRDVAEFWINLKGRLIYIRYFAVRDKNGNYLGCMEVTQDITDIKKIEGEKRLL